MLVLSRRSLEFATLLLLAAAPIRAAELLAKWIGQADGDWSNAANWDIARVPNNTATDTFDVLWDAHPVTVRLVQNVTIRNFTFSSGGTLDAPATTLNLRIMGDFQWLRGTLAIGQRTTVQGNALLQSPPGNSLILNGGALFLKGSTSLRSVLECRTSAGLVNDTTGVFQVHNSAGIIRDNSSPEFDNLGKLQILGGDTVFQCIYLVNWGEIEINDRTVEFPALGNVSSFWQRGGSLHLNNANLKCKFLASAGSVEGRGYIRDALIHTAISGQLNFDDLALGNSAASTVTLRGSDVGNNDRFVVAHNFFVGGNLAVRLADGFEPAPGAFFEIMSSPQAILGSFANINFGQRIALTGGVGTFLIERTADQTVGRLRDFVGGPLSLGAGALEYQLPETPPNGGCFIAPNASLNFPDGEWAGGSLEVEITAGFQDGIDVFEIRPNPAIPNSDVTTSDIAGGGKNLLFKGTPFGVARFSGARVTCDFNATAQNQGIVALLGRLFYSNRELAVNWYRTASDRYPARTLKLTLRNGSGTHYEVTREVPFPFLQSISIGDPVYLSEDRIITVIGFFSNSTIAPVPLLETVWKLSKPNFQMAAVAGQPGRIKLLSAAGRESCAVLRAQASSLRSEQIVWINQRVDIDGDHECTLWDIQSIYNVPVCESFPDGSGNPRRAAPATSTHISVATLRALHGLMKETAEGRRLSELYWMHTSETAKIVLADPSLLRNAAEMLVAFQPGLSALLAGKGTEVTITPAMIDQLNAVWAGFSNAGSVGLKAALEGERARFHGFQDFVGKNFAQWSQLLELPVPSKARVYVSHTTRHEGQFVVEANDVPGLVLVLRRSSDLKQWDLVPNVKVVRDGLTLRFTDPTPPAAGAFYEIRP